MANLPSIQRGGAVSSPGQSSITESAIRGPYAMLAKTLDDTSGSLDNLAVKEAEIAGTKAVTQNEDGSLSVEQVGPLSGRAGEVFNRSAKMTYLTRLGQKVQDDVLAKRIEFQGQPDSFAAWGNGYAEQMRAQASDEMRPAVDRMVVQHISENYQSLALGRAQMDKEAALTSYKSQLVTLDNRMAALARDGGTDTPEYQQALTDSRAIYNELGKSPMFNYPQARIDQEVSDMESRHQAEAVVGTASRIFDKKGAADAKQFLQAQLWDAKLNLTEAQRTRYTSLGMAALEGKTAEKQAQIQALKPEVHAHIDLLKKGADVDPRQTNDLIDKANHLGSPEMAYELNAWATYRPWLQVFRQSDDATRYRMLKTLSAKPGTVGAFRDSMVDKVNKAGLGAVGPVSEEAVGIRERIAAEAQRQGIDPKLAQTFSFLESSYNPTAVSKDADGQVIRNAAGQPQAYGLFQFTPETATRFGISEGSSADDQIRAGVSLMKETRDALRMQLNREPTAAEMYTAHFQGLGASKTIMSADASADLKTTLDNARPGWVSKSGQSWGEVVLAANPWLGDVGKGQQNPQLASVKMKILDSATAEMKGRLSRNVDELIDGMKKNNRPSLQDIQSVLDWVQLTGDFDSGRKFAEVLTAKENSDMLRNMPEDKRAELISSLTAKNAESSTHASRLALDFFKRADEQAREGMKNDPLNEFAARGWSAPPKAVDWGNPQAAAQEFSTRNQNIVAANARDPSIGPKSVLTSAEQGAFKAALTTGDPQQGMAILGAIAKSASPDNWRETMMSGAVKDGLDAAARSYDPTRLNTAMSTLDQLYHTDKIGFKEKYGDATLGRLQTWQAYKDSLSPEQMAEKFKQVDDPNTHDAREKLVKDAATKLGNVTPADVAGAIGVPWVPSFVARNVGIEASSPSDPVQGERMVNDYKDLVAQRYADIGDIDKAKKLAAETLKLRWGASPDVANNTVMLHPPERYYPAVNGSHSWMKRQLVDEVAKYIADKRGIKTSDDAIFEGGIDVAHLSGQHGSILPVGYDYKVIPDAQTEAEIKAGQSPSYQLFVTDDKGVVDIVRGKDNRELRYRWDAGPAQDNAAASFNRTRPLMLGNNDDVATAGGALLH